jgi:hypothetical protein
LTGSGGRAVYQLAASLPGQHVVTATLPGYGPIAGSGARVTFR